MPHATDAEPAPNHKTQRWERTLAATTEAPLERFEAKLVRWRRLGKNLVFLDVVRTGRDDEWAQHALGRAAAATLCATRPREMARARARRRHTT